MKISNVTYSESKKLVGAQKFESHLISIGLKIEKEEGETDQQAITKAKELVQAELKQEVARIRAEIEEEKKAIESG